MYHTVGIHFGIGNIVINWFQNGYKAYKYLPAMRNTARSAGSNCSMLRGLSLAHSFRLWSESKSMTARLRTTHQP